jgi:1-acyl-sn-glycerol-3-phosphate acyltransferase
VSTLVASESAPGDMGIVYRIGWTSFRLLFATYFRWRYFNPERVPRSGPVILASNHASFIDPPLVGAALPRAVAYLARDTLFRFRIMAWLLARWKAVPVDREGGGATGVRKILEVLAGGDGVIIFPEGTRTRSGELQPARSGIGLIVLKSEAPVVPVRVFGTFEAFGRHLPFPKPRPVAVKYGQPLRFDALRLESRTCSKARLKDIYREIAEEIMTSIARLQPFEDKDRFPG